MVAGGAGGGGALLCASGATSMGLRRCWRRLRKIHDVNHYGNTVGANPNWKAIMLDKLLHLNTNHEPNTLKDLAVAKEL